MSLESAIDARPPAAWRSTGAMLLLAAAVLIGIAFRDSFALMWEFWTKRAEYSHGLVVPVVSSYLLWQRRAELMRAGAVGSWWGFAIVLAGCLLLVAGLLATLYIVQQYALLLVIAGLALALLGPRTIRAVAVPLALLLFMVPLPDFLLNNLSAQLQLLSSQIGVAIIRAFGISVHLSGNVIDLGSHQLEVAEACSGLRYLFPLMTLGFIVAYLYDGPLWQRVVLFASSVPLTVTMNSLRIGLIGVAVDRWGPAMAEQGPLHDFEGWIMFMAGTGLLLAEVVLFARWRRDPRPWRDVFGLEASANPAPGATLAATRPAFAALVLLAITTGLALALPQRAELRPARESFATYPLQVGPWEGRRDALEPVELDTLKLDDYVLADYRRAGRVPVNFYVAWYDSQRAGQSAHSPRSCLPGGGWQIVELDRRALPGVAIDGTPLVANRAVIQLGDRRQVVYYWFQQRGRIVNNEYLVKWHILRDALFRNRTDGALVRLVAPVPSGSPDSVADAELAAFAAVALDGLSRYVPR